MVSRNGCNSVSRELGFFDFDQKIAAPNTEFPHMLPTVEQFAQEVGKLGINNHSHIVVYDSHGIFSSPRVWWMFKVMGHDSVSVLDGGITCLD